MEKIQTTLGMRNDITSGWCTLNIDKTVNDNINELIAVVSDNNRWSISLYKKPQLLPKSIQFMPFF